MLLETDVSDINLLAKKGDISIVANEGDVSVTVDEGNAKIETVLGDTSINAGGDVDIVATGNVNIKGAKVKINPLWARM